MRLFSDDPDIHHGVCAWCAWPRLLVGGVCEQCRYQRPRVVGLPEAVAAPDNDADED